MLNLQFSEVKKKHRMTNKYMGLKGEQVKGRTIIKDIHR